jgi:hypothetical protein
MPGKEPPPDAFDEDDDPGFALPEDDLDEELGPGGFSVPGFVRKVATAGLGAVFMSEEGIRRLSAQLKLPKEVVGSVLSQAEKTKDEVTRAVSEEVRRFLQSDRLKDELVRLLAGMTIEVRAELRLVPQRTKDDGVTLSPRIRLSGIRARATDEKRRKKDD